MAGKIILNVIEGAYTGTRYRFDSRMLCLIGRAPNCTIQLQGEAAEGLSRCHCLLDIRPPRALIQDLGSKNGTFLNEHEIGNAKMAEEKDLPFYELSDNDTIRIGSNVFRITLIQPGKCHVCHKVLPENTPPDPVTGYRICTECLSIGLRSPILPASKTLPMRTCSVCGLTTVFSPDDPVPPPGAFKCPECSLRNDGNPNSTQRIPENNKLPSNLFSIPGYRILRHLGKGGMGDVYLGQDTETLEKVAVKVLRPDIASYENCRTDFLRETENLRRMHHPNIIEWKNFYEQEEAYYLVLEYCSGGTLRNWMEQNGQLDMRTALDLTYQILDGLDYAHHLRFTQVTEMDDKEHTVTGLVHRDITPRNIFISISEDIPSAKISDFGLAKAFELAGLSGNTRTGNFSGTLGFICKQQLINYKYARPEVDVWAAAAVLYYMLTGMPPRDFSGDDSLRAFEKPPVSIAGKHPELTSALIAVIDGALDDSGKLRYATASALKMALMAAE